MITLVAIDPGTTESALVAMSGEQIEDRIKAPNADVLARLDWLRLQAGPDTLLAVEMVSSYGRAVGAEVFETCVWIGRYVQAWGGRFALVPRMAVKMGLCADSRAGDPQVRAALIERYGGKAAAIGKRKEPGPLAGITKDLWAALGLACVVGDRVVDEGSGRALACKTKIVVQTARPG